MKVLFRSGIIVMVMTLVAAMPHGAHAASDERINDLSTTLHIDTHNVADITETISYDFGASEHHGIYRSIPTTYDTADGSYYTSVKVMDITQDGASIEKETDEQSENTVVKIGDPDKTITGTHTYKVHYQIKPLVISRQGHDFLDYDVTGEGWEVPIDHATASVELDNNATISSAACYTGFQGSTSQNCTNEGMSFAASNLPAHEGLTINGTLPDHYVDTYLVAGKRPWTADRIANLVFPLLILLVIWVVVMFLAIRHFRERKRKQRQTVVAQYESPDNLTPAELGLLDDNKASMREITATLIDLAVRGHLKIEQTDKKGMLHGAKYTLTKLQGTDTKRDYEEQLVTALFGDAATVEMDKVDRTKVSAAIAKINKGLKDGLSERGYYAKSSDSRSLFGKIFNTGAITDSGAEAWARVEGFKLYLGVAEKDRLNFSDAPERTPERFNKLLPYAVALNVEKEWAKQFEGIDVAGNSSWYVSNYGAFTALSLASDIGDGFSTAASSNMAAPSSSSGGGAGGGFGGGGGGSW